MVRGIVSGLVWGGVVASAGLAVISQIAPLPQRDAGISAASESPATDPATDSVGEAGAEAPDMIATAPVAQSADGPDQTAAAPPTQPDAPEAEAQQAPAEMPEAGTEGDEAVAIAPVAPDAFDPTAPDAPKAPAAPGIPPAPVASVESAPDAPDVPVAGDASSADPRPPQVDLPPPPPRPALDEALIAPLPPTEPAPQDAVEQPDVAGTDEATGAPPQPAAPLPQIAGDEAAPSDPAVPLPAPSDAPDSDAPDIDGSVAVVPELPGQPADALPPADPSVATDRLPRIGIADPLPEVEVIAEDAAPLRPIDAFAVPFDNAGGKPLFAILLADDGADAADRQELAALPFPVTFVLDPLSPDAAAAAAIYRAGLKEVVFAATGLPQGATAADVEQAFQAHVLALPETVAVIDQPTGGFQDSRTMSGAVLPILAEQGRGLLTYDRGLNAADQIARREGVPSATVFRRLDAEGESIPTMRRYLDRAAFRAAQEGEVVVIGSTRPETVAALLEWTVEGRAASVALAPVSAILNRK